MSRSMKFYRDGDGDLQVESGPSSQLIGRFLIEDIQDSPTHCHEILKGIEGISRGEMASWRRVGNAHLLVLTKGEAVIESLFESSAEPCRLSLGEFRDIVESWQHFLEG
jgi:hypothetical protein